MGNQAYKSQKRKIMREGNKILANQEQRRRRSVGAEVRVIDVGAENTPMEEQLEELKQWMEGVENSVVKMGGTMAQNFRVNAERISEVVGALRRVNGRLERVEAKLDALIQRSDLRHREIVSILEAGAVEHAPTSEVAASPPPPPPVATAPVKLPDHHSSLRNMARLCGLRLSKARFKDTYYMSGPDFAHTEYQDLTVIERDVRRYARDHRVPLDAYPHDRSAPDSVE